MNIASVLSTIFTGMKSLTFNASGGLVIMTILFNLMSLAMPQAMVLRIASHVAVRMGFWVFIVALSAVETAAKTRMNRVG